MQTRPCAVEMIGEVAVNVADNKKSPAGNLSLLQINKLLTVREQAVFDTLIHAL